MESMGRYQTLKQIYLIVGGNSSYKKLSDFIWEAIQGTGVFKSGIKLELLLYKK